MQLNQLQDIMPRKRGKRVGRGIGSGKGKTSGAGVKGQKARTGVAVNGFEGGQMPIHRRLPKRGFHSINRVEYQVVNLSDLERLVSSGAVPSGSEVTPEVLLNVGLLRKSNQKVKLLAKGSLTHPVVVSLHAASASAKLAVEKVGGRVSIS